MDGSVFKKSHWSRKANQSPQLTDEQMTLVSSDAGTRSPGSIGSTGSTGSSIATESTVADTKRLLLRTRKGPSEREFTLVAPGPFSAGRRSTHPIQLGEHDVISRDHARFELEADPTGGQWYIIDTNSTHGTRLNGIALEPGRRYPIQPDDFIEIAPWAFQVIDPANPTAESDSFSKLAAENAQQVSSVQQIKEPARRSESSELFAQLISQVDAIFQAGNLKELAEVIVRSAVLGTGYRNAAMLRHGQKENTVEILATSGKISTPDGDATYSRTLIEQASHGKPVMLREEEMPEDVAVSIVNLGIREAICVPIFFGRSDVVGCYLYLDKRSDDSGTALMQADVVIDYIMQLAKLAGAAVTSLKSRSLEKQMASIEAEIDKAAQAQRYFLPEREGRIDSFSYIGENRPGRQVSGDFFDVVKFGDGRLAVTLGDVCGKGMQAALLMTSAHSFLRAMLLQHGDPATAIHHLNQFLLPRCADNRFITLWVGVFDPQAKTVTYVDAGHGYGILMRSGEATALNENGGVPLGIDGDMTYANGQSTIQANDQIVIVSDGLIEQPDPPDATGKQEEFGIDRVLDILKQTQGDADQVLHIFDAVQRHAGGPSVQLADDATAVIVGCHGD